MNKTQLKKIILKEVRHHLFLREGFFDAFLGGPSKEEKKHLRAALAADPELLDYFDKLIANGWRWEDAFEQAKSVAEPGMLGVKGFHVPPDLVQTILRALDHAEEIARNRTFKPFDDSPDDEIEPNPDEDALRIIAKLRKIFNKLSDGRQLRNEGHGAVSGLLVYLAEHDYPGFNQILDEWEELHKEVNPLFERKQKRTKPLRRRRRSSR